MLKRSRNINYKAWEYWEPDTESEEEGDLDGFLLEPTVVVQRHIVAWYSIALAANSRICLAFCDLLVLFGFLFAFFTQSISLI